MKVDELIIANQTKNQNIEFKNIMNVALKSIEQCGTEINSQKVVIKDLVNKVSMYEDKLKVQQEHLNVEIEQKKSSLDLRSRIRSYITFWKMNVSVLFAVKLF